MSGRFSSSTFFNSPLYYVIELDENISTPNRKGWFQHGRGSFTQLPLSRVEPIWIKISVPFSVHICISNYLLELNIMVVDKNKKKKKKVRVSI